MIFSEELVSENLRKGVLGAFNKIMGGSPVRCFNNNTFLYVKNAIDHRIEFVFCGPDIVKDYSDPMKYIISLRFSVRVIPEREAGRVEKDLPLAVDIPEESLKFLEPEGISKAAEDKILSFNWSVYTDPDF